MKNIKFAFVTLFLGLSGLWLMADSLWPSPFSYFAFRERFIQYSGVLAMGAMSVGMLIALRLPWLETWLNGLDKGYRLHKWLGIMALVLGVLHWWWAQGTKWMVGWGWLERPVRRVTGAAGSMSGALEPWLRTQRGLAESMGEWSFYAVAVLVIVALLRRVPYHWFVKTHKILALAYLALVWHTVVLLKFTQWGQPIGLAMAALMAGGCWAAGVALLGRIGARRRVPGRVLETEWFAPLRVLRTTLRLEGPWPGHRAGQFAFVSSVPGERAHPYTIASSWDAAAHSITFVTKVLGDHTRRLPEVLKPGLPVVVEGPYGRFTFDDAQPRQIWVGAGIGITPFLARLDQLAEERRPRGNSPKPAVDLFHTTRDIDPLALRRVEQDALAAGVALHIFIDERDGMLTGERIRALVPGWQEASLWFCGPTAFGQALQADFAAQGCPVEHFHQELFSMR